MGKGIDLNLIRQRTSERYFATARDTALLKFVDMLRDNAKAMELGGVGSHRRSLFVIGDTGSGKTRSINRVLSEVPEWKSTVNQYGDPVEALIRIKPPKPCSMKALAVRLLLAMKVPVPRRMTDPELYVFLEEQLRERGVKAIWIDEMQDVLRSNTPAAVQAVQDTLKALVQIDGWPIHTIYSGVPAVATFLKGDRQLARRAYVMRYERVEYPDDKEWIEKILHTVVVDDCEMSLADEIKSEIFTEKLCRAASGAFGSIVELVQEACFRAGSSGRRQVRLRDFAKVHEEMSGCKRVENVFTAANWREIIPENSLDDMGSPSSRGARG